MTAVVLLAVGCGSASQQVLQRSPDSGPTGQSVARLQFHAEAGHQPPEVWANGIPLTVTTYRWFDGEAFQSSYPASDADVEVTTVENTSRLEFVVEAGVRPLSARIKVFPGTEFTGGPPTGRGRDIDCLREEACQVTVIDGSSMTITTDIAWSSPTIVTLQLEYAAVVPPEMGGVDGNTASWVVQL